MGIKIFYVSNGCKKLLVSNGSKKIRGVKSVKNNFGCQMGVKNI